jgi:hypothetical protein
LALSASSRTCTSTRSSGTKRSQSSGSVPIPFGPEADRVVAAGDELVAVLGRNETELAQLGRGRSCCAAMSQRMHRARLLAPLSGGLTMTGTVIPSARTSISTSS